jgi:hypothetical protein
MDTMLRRSVGLLLLLLFVAALVFGTQTPVIADGGPGGTGGPGSDPKEPIEIIDAAFADLSHQLGLTLGPEVTVYRWVDDSFFNTDLNCKTPGKVLPRERVRGFSIWIRLVIKGRFIPFIYRSTRDGSVLFQCTSAGPGPLIKVPGAPFPESIYQIVIANQDAGTDTIAPTTTP